MKLILVAICLTLSTLSQAKSVSFMQYNVENFFDLSHDAGTEDWTYLPLEVKAELEGHWEACQKLGTDFYKQECINLDWAEWKFQKKIQNISKVIKSFDASQMGPDILMVEEVENIDVLNQLVAQGLQGMGYKHQILIDGDDTRGIDVGLISKYPVISSKRHSLVIDGKKIDTRGILEVELDLGGKTATVFVSHWPSQSNPTSQRIASAQLLDSLANASDSDLVLAGGDFNTLETEKPNPFDSLVNWVDAEHQARSLNVTMNPGTHFYKGKWSSLDHIFIHKKSKLKPNYKSFQIVNRPFMLQKDARSGVMMPIRFNFETANGFADHLPMGLSVDL